MGFPIGTKVYLEDKTLKNIEDLQFGDKILSIKTKDSEILTHSEFYHRYIKLNNKREGFFIQTGDTVLCSATVYSVFVHKNFGNFKSLNNNILSGIDPILIQKDLEVDHMYLKNADSIIGKMISGENEENYFIQSLDSKPFNLNVETLDDNIFVNPDQPFLKTKIEDFESKISNQISVSLVLLDNYFFLTENFICLSHLIMEEN